MVYRAWDAWRTCVPARPPTTMTKRRFVRFPDGPEKRCSEKSGHFTRSFFEGCFVLKSPSPSGEI